MTLNASKITTHNVSASGQTIQFFGRNGETKTALLEKTKILAETEISAETLFSAEIGSFGRKGLFSAKNASFGQNIVYS